MKILSCSGQEVVIQIIRSRWSPWKLFLHDWYQVGVDFVNLVSSEQVGDLSRGEDIVDVLEETLVFDFIVGEEEGDPLALLPGCSVEHLQVVQEVVGIVGARQLDLECLVASDVGGQSSETLLARAPHSNQECCTSICADDAGYLDEVNHGIFEEHQIHAGTSNCLVVLQQKVGESLLQLWVGWNLQQRNNT